MQPSECPNSSDNVTTITAPINNTTLLKQRLRFSS